MFQRIVGRKGSRNEKTDAKEKTRMKHHDFDPTTFYKTCFWNRRPDGML